jgi:SAM-dependent methyltransferase
MTTKIGEVYNREFFDMHVAWLDDYDVLAIGLLWYLDFETVIDLGCGNGYLAGALASAGKDVRAYDGSPYAGGYAGGVEIGLCDLSNKVDLRHQADLVCCIEVGEHLTINAASTLVGNIGRHAKKWVAFSAAEQGFGGHAHLNEQPRKYWLEKFARFGFQLDRNRTFLLRWGLRHACFYTFWFAKNIMVLART